MSQHFKLILYAVLTMAVCCFGFLAWRNYHRLMADTAASDSDSSSDNPASEERPARPASAGFAKGMWTYGSLFVAFVIGLGFLAGHDLAHYLGNKTMKVLYNDEGEGLRNPEYDQAEQAWADGQYLEAIQLMREFLNKNPREVHAAIRIAEIYEKDLHNPLAAALEYEEIIQQNLPRERWGWSAIHLCNLYFKLNQTDKAVALLRRIDSEYSETQAAEKARKRLALFETEAGSENVAMEENSPSDERSRS